MSSAALRLAFAGTPAFALPALETCLRGPHALVGVWTQPDRPAGRGRQPASSPVKQRAEAAGVPVYQPRSLKGPRAQAQLAAAQADLLIVVAYGLILPAAVLDTPAHGCWNLHASLLPRWRGAAPIQRAVLAGDAATGVCLMRMEAGLDTGPVLLRASTPIGRDDTSGSLHDRLATIGAELLREGLERLAAGTLPPAQEQSAADVRYADKLSKDEARLDLSRPAAELERAVRAFQPWPVAEVRIDGERVRVHAAAAIERDAGAAPGALLDISGAGVDMATGRGVLRITRLQRDGGRVISAADFANARRAQRGSRS